MRVAFVCHDYVIGISAMVIETIKTLAAKNMDVDIFIGKENYSIAPATFEFPNVRLIFAPSYPSSRTKVFSWSLPRKICVLIAALQHWLAPRLGFRGSLSNYFQAFQATYLAHLNVLETHFRTNRYGVVIGVDTIGLIVACHMVELWQPDSPIIYYNMELPEHKWSMRPGKHIIKHIETLCSHRARFSVIADEERGKAYARVNGVDISTVRYLPISTGGEPVMTKSRIFQERFGLADDTVIVLYAGTVELPSVMGLESVQSVDDWPENCVLVIHSWNPATAKDPLFQQMKAAANPHRVFFSLHPVPPEKLSELISSAHIGLAFYKPIDMNHVEIGSSSNKLAQYARVGLPTITNRLASVEAIFNRFHSGICVNHPRGTGRAIEDILKDYEKYRQGAFQSYQKHYNFAVHFDPILKEMHKLSSQ
jgi:hypothetical protein